MRYPSYTSGDVILLEGKWFPFIVYNLLQLQDGALYYVLQDINGLKHFMPAEYYTSYGFKVGDEIICKVDKINCTGRIFLEPKHPFYSEGEIYFFDLIFESNKHNRQLLIVKEILGNYIELPVYDIKNIVLNEEKKVKCVVISIKKGMPILEII